MKWLKTKKNFSDFSINTFFYFWIIGRYYVSWSTDKFSHWFVSLVITNQKRYEIQHPSVQQKNANYAIINGNFSILTKNFFKEMYSIPSLATCSLTFIFSSIKDIISSCATWVNRHLLHFLKFISTTWNVLIAVYVHYQRSIFNR